MTSLVGACQDSQPEQYVSEPQRREEAQPPSALGVEDGPGPKSILLVEQHHRRELAADPQLDPPQLRSVTRSKAEDAPDCVAQTRDNEGGEGGIPQTQSETLQVPSGEAENGGALGFSKLKRVKSEGCVLKRQQLVCSSSLPITTCYHLGDVIGIGTWGTVHTAVERFSGLERVVKRVCKELHQQEMPRFRQEVQLCRQLDHPNIVRLYETFEDHKSIYLVMEYCRGGDLLSWVHRRQDAIAAGARGRRRKRKRGGTEQAGASRKADVLSTGSGMPSSDGLSPGRCSLSSPGACREEKGAEGKCTGSLQAQALSAQGRECRRGHSSFPACFVRPPCRGIGRGEDEAREGKNSPSDSQKTLPKRRSSLCDESGISGVRGWEEEVTGTTEAEVAAGQKKIPSRTHGGSLAVQASTTEEGGGGRQGQQATASMEGDVVAANAGTTAGERPSPSCTSVGTSSAPKPHAEDEEEDDKEPLCSEIQAARFMLQLLSALCYLHQKGIAHRDIKLENLLLVHPFPADEGLRRGKDPERVPHAEARDLVRPSPTPGSPTGASRSLAEDEEVTDSPGAGKEADILLRPLLGDKEGKVAPATQAGPRRPPSCDLREVPACKRSEQSIPPWELSVSGATRTEMPDRIALVDFGLARRFTAGSSGSGERPLRRRFTARRLAGSGLRTGGLMSSCVGTLYYLSPFMLKGLPYDEVQSDMWAAGVVLYILICGAPPFDGNTEAEIINKVLKTHVAFTAPCWDAISEECKDLISRLLHNTFLPQTTYSPDVLSCGGTVAGSSRHSTFPTVSTITADASDGSIRNRQGKPPATVPAAGGGGEATQEWLPGVPRRMDAATTLRHPWFASVQRQLWAKATRHPPASMPRSLSTPSFLQDGGGGRLRCAGSEYPRCTFPALDEAMPPSVYGQELSLSPGSLEGGAPSDFEASQRIHAAPGTRHEDDAGPEVVGSLRNPGKLNTRSLRWTTESDKEHDEEALWRADGTGADWTSRETPKVAIDTEKTSGTSLVFLPEATEKADGDHNGVEAGGGTVSARSCKVFGESHSLNGFRRDQRPPAALPVPVTAVGAGRHRECPEASAPLSRTPEEMADLLHAFRLRRSPLHFCWSPGCTVLREEACGSISASTAPLTRSIHSYPTLARTRRPSTVSLRDGSALLGRRGQFPSSTGKRDGESDTKYPDRLSDPGGATGCCSMSCVLEECGTQTLKCLCCPSVNRAVGAGEDVSADSPSSRGRPSPVCSPSSASGSPCSHTDLRSGFLSVPHLHLYIGDAGGATSSRLAARGGRSHRSVRKAPCCSASYDMVGWRQDAAKVYSSSCSAGSLSAAAEPFVQPSLSSQGDPRVRLSELGPNSDCGLPPQAGSGKEDGVAAHENGPGFRVLGGGVRGWTGQVALAQETGDGRAVAVSGSHVDTWQRHKCGAPSRGCFRCGHGLRGGSHIEGNQRKGKRLATGQEEDNERLQGQLGAEAGEEASPLCSSGERRRGPAEGREEQTADSCVFDSESTGATKSEKSEGGMEACSRPPASLGVAHARERRQLTSAGRGSGRVVNEANPPGKGLEAEQVAACPDNCHFTKARGHASPLKADGGESSYASCVRCAASLADDVEAQRDISSSSVSNSCSPVPGPGPCCCSSSLPWSESASTCASASPRTRISRGVAPSPKNHTVADHSCLAPLSCPMCSAFLSSQGGSPLLAGCPCPSCPSEFPASASSPSSSSEAFSCGLLHCSPTHPDPSFPVNFRPQQEETDKREVDPAREAFACAPSSDEQWTVQADSALHRGGKPTQGSRFWRCVSLTEPEQAGVFRSRNLLLVAATAWRRFAALGPLQRALRTVFAREMEDEPGVQVLREVFYALDRHHRGAVDPDDVQWGLSLAREFVTAECVCRLLEGKFWQGSEERRAPADWGGRHHGYRRPLSRGSPFQESGDQHLVLAAGDGECCRVPSPEHSGSARSFTACADTRVPRFDTPEVSASSGPGATRGTPIRLVPSQTGGKVRPVQDQTGVTPAHEEASSEYCQVPGYNYPCAGDFLVSPSLPPELRSLLRLAGLSSSGVGPPLGELLPYLFNLHMLLGVAVPKFFTSLRAWVTPSCAAGAGKERRLDVSAQLRDDGGDQAAGPGRRQRTEENKGGGAVVCGADRGAVAGRDSAREGGCTPAGHQGLGGGEREHFCIAESEGGGRHNERGQAETRAGDGHTGCCPEAATVHRVSADCSHRGVFSDVPMLQTDQDGTVLDGQLRSAGGTCGVGTCGEGDCRGEGELWRLRDVIAGMDTDGSGTIEFVEFLAASLGDADLRRREVLCRAAYRYFDRNFDGLVCYRDLLGVLSLQPGTHESTAAFKANTRNLEGSTASASLCSCEVSGQGDVGDCPREDASSAEVCLEEDEGFLQDLEHVNPENLLLYRAVLSELKAVDGDHDGFITYEEFLCLLH